MPSHLPALSLRRAIAAGVAVLGVAGVAAAAAPAADAATSCATYLGKYANSNVATLTASQRQHTGVCAVNAARAQNGVTALKSYPALLTSSLGHANRSVALRWWSLTDGLASHVDPSQAGLTPSAAIAQRIANAGFCAGGQADTNENTFSAWGTGQFPPTINGAVAWWLQDPPHRATLLSTRYTGVGFAAVPGSAFGQDTGGAAAGTFVTDFGRCTR